MSDSHITVLIFIVVVLSQEFTIGKDVTERCQDACERVSAQIADTESLRCNSTCRLQQCNTGCGLWEKALGKSCVSVCNSTWGISVQVQPCVAGCSAALHVYALDFQESLGELVRPHLVAGSKRNTSVILSWSSGKSPGGSTRKLSNSGATYLVQLKIHKVDKEWHYHPNITWITPHKVRIKHLHPYVTYKFQIVAELTSLVVIPVSKETVPIATEPYGVPSESPVISSLTSRPTSIHIKWDPPQFTNGPLVGYQLIVVPRNGSNHLPKVKDVPRTRSGSVTEVMTLLEPDMDYIVRVMAINRAGRGPDAVTSIRTPPQQPSSEMTPYLVFGAKNMVLKQELDLLLNFENIGIYEPDNSSALVTGVAIHFTERLVFFSEENGNVYRLHLASLSRYRVIYSSPEEPRALSVDWLHDHLYIAQETSIVRCNLDGLQCITVVSRMTPRAEEIRADPCNGYLYWAQNGRRRGLYRVDLAKLGRPLRDLSHYRIVKVNILHSFVVDYLNYRIYFPNETQNTMMSVYLDGTDRVDIRRNVQSPDFIEVKSLVYYAGLFYWTNGGKMVAEEYAEMEKMYHHNEMPLFKDPFSGLNVLHPSSQPIPEPLLPPRDLQVLFTSNSAIMKWKPPEWDQGRGAWREWRYRVEMYNHETGKTHTYNLDASGGVIEHLQPSHSYTFKVQAFSTAGTGPWSDTFHGDTLKPAMGVEPQLIFANKSHIFRTQLDGKVISIDVGLNQTTGKVTDLTMYEGSYFWSTDAGTVLMLTKDGVARRVNQEQEASALAFEPLANMLYWANPKHNMILRRRVGTSQIEVVYQGRSSAQDIVLDSVKGYIYWATSLTVEVAHLNGDNHQVIHTLPYFLGKYVLGLTLDFDNEKLYWIIKEINRTLLYRIDMLHAPNDQATNGERVAEFDTPPIAIGLQYYSGRLFWVSYTGLVVIMDTRGHSQASITLPSGGKISAFTLAHPSISGCRAHGRNLTSADVIPAQIDGATLMMVGTWDNYTLSWDPTPVAHGDVKYRLLFKYDGAEERKETVVSQVSVQGMRPYTEVALSMQSCTYWGCSIIVQKTFRTPMAAPSAPQKPRTFVTYIRSALTSNYTIRVSLHWSLPEHPNGEIMAYRLYEAEDINGPWEMWLVDRLYHQLPEAKHFHRYYFKVDACTKVGCGNKTGIAVADTRYENPVPTLITTSQTAIGWFYPDDQRYRAMAEGHFVALTFMAIESVLFGLDIRNHIVKLDGHEKKELLDMNGTGKSIAVDWIGRDLYWIEETMGGQYAIRTYDLNKDNGHTNVVLKREQAVGKVAVNPYQSAIYWSEVDSQSGGRIMKSDMDGKEVSSVFQSMRSGESRLRRQSCSCPDLSVTNVFAMDHTQKENAEIYIVQAETGSIWASDITGCNCRLVVNGTGKEFLGLPPDSLAVDHQRVYWSNKVDRVLNSANKHTGLDLVRENLGDIQQILAYGPHLQPLPDPTCLTPTAYAKRAEFSGHESSRLHLKLLNWQPLLQCHGISLPTVKYTIHYRQVEPGDQNKCNDTSVMCKKKSTYDLDVWLDDLEPYESYQIQVSTSNYHTEQHPEKYRQVLGPPAIYKTREGTPSPPENVTAYPTTPQQVKVQWKGPEKPNGDPHNLTYVVEWRTENDDGSSSNNKLRARNRRYNDTERYQYALVDNLRAEKTYFFKVLVYDRYGSSYSVSEEVTTTTFQYPGPIWLMEHGQSWIQVAWQSPSDDSISRHIIEKTPVGEQLAWQNKHDVYYTQNATVYNHTFRGLEANTEYAFRVRVIYLSNEFFVWPITTKYTFRTAADIPGQPNPPIFLSRGMVAWHTPPDGGSPIIAYKLLARKEEETNWTVVYNGSDSKWEMSALQIGSSYVYKVAALNAMGWGPLSDNSSVFLFNMEPQPLTAVIDNLTVALAASFGTIFLMIILVIFAIFLVCRKNKNKKPVPLDFVVTGRPPDMELATLRELPRITTQQTNALYAINIVPTDEDIAALPHFRRDQLQLTKFLGSGAFGEVFEGVANNILTEDSGDTKVAVKTLRKGATEQEKEEFLKEALLMSNFKHEHIIRLLGVCLDNDPQFIILELMEGGDLLSYLRSSRPTAFMETSLYLPDMINICVDVARGCCYLEDMHFVHRDLAARNCLVSSKDPLQRVVKIGDFGLARDIYKNDYYRKEGEGLLPVRWMSPESLVDGVFTTQSDVWAFGVMMWEVLTLGQQPYPARTNIEVLHYVRSAGRLDRPENCPDDMYHLMLKCWSYTPDDRPSFYYILEQLESFKRISQDMNSAFSGRPTSAEGGSAGGSKASSSVGGKRRLFPFLGGHGDIDTAQSSKDLSAKQPAKVKKALSCDMGPSVLPPMLQPMDSQGYLAPVSQQNSKPKYLELLSDSPEPSTSHLERVVPSGGQKNKLGSAPMLSAKLLRVSPARSLNYAQLASESFDSVVDSDNPSVLDSDTPCSTIEKPRPHSTGSGPRNLNTVPNSAASDTDLKNVPTSPQPLADSLPINYACITHNALSESDMDTDNEVVDDSSRPGSCDTALDEHHPHSHSVSRSPSRSGMSDEFIDRTNDPVLVLPDSQSQSETESHDSEYLGQNQADVRSKITGDTDLRSMGLHIWEPGDLIPENNPNNNNLFLSNKRDSSPFLRDVSPYSDQSSLRNSPFRFDGMDEKSTKPFICDGFLAPHDVDYRRNKLDRTSPINGIPLSRITSSSDSSF